MNTKYHLHSIEFLRTVLTYDAQTGDFYFLARPRELFQSQRSCSSWKSRFEGKKAFGKPKKNGYLRTSILGLTYYAHRLAWALHYGEWPVAEIDHINGDRADNRIINLRSVSHVENCRNLSKPINNTSGVIGVSWSASREKWVAYIDDAKGRIPLGRFTEFHEAVIARKAAETALRYHPNHGK